MKPMNKETALVVYSGGQDSTTCLFWALKHFQKVVALTFTYGQKHVLEVKMAQTIAAKAGEVARRNGLNEGGGEVEWHQMDGQRYIRELQLIMLSLEEWDHGQCFLVIAIGLFLNLM